MEPGVTPPQKPPEIQFIISPQTLQLLEEERKKRKRPRRISTGQLNPSQGVHLRPMYPVVSGTPYFLRMGYLILEAASRLDAFSGYPCRT